jgi:hypothetical protein
MLCCNSGRRKGIAGLLLGIWRKERRIAGALLGFQLLLLVLAGIVEDRKAASYWSLRWKIRAASLLFACRPEREQSGCCYTLDLATGENQREERRGKERLLVVEQSRSASKLGWRAPRNDACARVVWHSHA